MELKTYQEDVLERFEKWVEILNEKHSESYAAVSLLR